MSKYHIQQLINYFASCEAQEIKIFSFKDYELKIIVDLLKKEEKKYDELIQRIRESNILEE